MDACLAAIDALVAHADRNEPGTRFIASFRDPDDACHFLLTRVFEDERAEQAHQRSAPAERLHASIREGADGVRIRSWEADTGI